MNERIKELAEQATTKEEFYPAGCNGYPEYRYDFDKEKFAELLLKDVLAIVKNNTPNPDPYNEDYDEKECGERTANDIRDEIKYRFGVSE